VCGFGGSRAKSMARNEAKGVAREETAQRPLGPGVDGTRNAPRQEGERKTRWCRLNAKRMVDKQDEGNCRRETHFSGVAKTCLAEPEPTTGCLDSVVPAPEAGRLSRAGRWVFPWRAGVWPWI
jgi:hypothetical protein